MKDLVKTLEKIDRFEELKTEVLDIVSKHNSKQIMCQGLIDNPTDWVTGTGKIKDLPCKEQDFCIVNPDLTGTVLEHYIKKYNGFRTRIMVMPGRHCYSVHHDPTPRIHIPIVTSDQAWMIWPFSNECTYLRPGQAYWTDTRRMHTFINGAETIRIHVVICVEA